MFTEVAIVNPFLIRSPRVLPSWFIFDQKHRINNESSVKVSAISNTSIRIRRSHNFDKICPLLDKTFRNTKGGYNVKCDVSYFIEQMTAFFTRIEIPGVDILKSQTPGGLERKDKSITTMLTTLLWSNPKM